MSYKYINPGYAVLCEDAIKNLQHDNDTGRNPYNNGINFYTDGRKIRLFKAFEANEIWVKIGISFNAQAPGLILIDSTGKGVGIDISESLCRVKRDTNGNCNYTKVYTLQQNIYYEYGLHVKFNSTDLTKSYMEIFLNGKLVDTYTDNILSGPMVDNYIYCGYWSFLSNIIISDTAFDFTEKIGIAPIKTTETTMTTNTDGTYTSTTAGQNIYQTVDTDKIKADAPKIKKITGLAVVGNPAYFIGSGLTKLKMQTKTGDTIDIKDTKILTTSTTEGVMTSWGTDYSLDDLKNIKLGIESAE